jgi:hypothetical protein
MPDCVWFRRDLLFGKVGQLLKHRMAWASNSIRVRMILLQDSFRSCQEFF